MRVLQIRVDERPVSTWPREVVQQLHQLLQLRTEWHQHRVVSLAAASLGGMASKADDSQEDLDVQESPFLRHKGMTAFQTKVLRDRVDAEDGWVLSNLEQLKAKSKRCADRHGSSNNSPSGANAVALRSSLASRGGPAVRASPSAKRAGDFAS